MKIDLKKDLKIYKTGDILEKGDIYMICRVKRNGRLKFFFLNLYNNEALEEEFNSVSELLSYYRIDETWTRYNGDKVTIKNH